MLILGLKGWVCRFLFSLSMQFYLSEIYFYEDIHFIKIVKQGILGTIKFKVFST